MPDDDMVFLANKHNFRTLCTISPTYVVYMTEKYTVVFNGKKIVSHTDVRSPVQKAPCGAAAQSGNSSRPYVRRQTCDACQANSH
jgi:hypothetical protein